MPRLKRLFVVAAFVALLTPGVRASDWSGTDRALLSAALVMHAADWSQTLRIAGQPETYYERNPILGRHPSRGEVNAYFATTALLMTAAAHLLPEYRLQLLGGWIAVQAIVVHNNLGIGLRIGF